MDENFYTEEERDGYKVSAEMKQIWATELNLLKELLRVCEKNGLKIWVEGGTMIGAVRHHGFIPWDDDIDTVMMRDDYDKLVALAPKEFKEPYFFQNIYSDPYYNHQHSQLRDSRTTAMAYGSRMKYNQGIFVDIFVLDSYPKTLKTSRLKMAKVRRAHDWLKLVQGITRKLPHWFYLKHRWDVAAFRYYENVLRQPAQSETPFAAGISLNQREKIKVIEDYSDTVYGEFEGLRVPMPVGYHRVLTNDYGDYMTPVIEPSLHGSMFFDPNRSYREYLKNPPQRPKE
jgi:lipopolysaccharide cholinephosphotransferase